MESSLKEDIETIKRENKNLQFIVSEYVGNLTEILDWAFEYSSKEAEYHHLSEEHAQAIHFVRAYEILERVYTICLTLKQKGKLDSLHENYPLPPKSEIFTLIRNNISQDLYGGLEQTTRSKTGIENVFQPIC